MLRCDTQAHILDFVVCVPENYVWAKFGSDGRPLFGSSPSLPPSFRTYTVRAREVRCDRSRWNMIASQERRCFERKGCTTFTIQLKYIPLYRQSRLYIRPICIALKCPCNHTEHNSN